MPVQSGATGIALAPERRRISPHRNLMNHTSSTLRLILTSMAGAALMTGCDKKEPAAGGPSAVPVAALPDAPPQAVATGEPAPALTGEAAMEAFKAEVKGIKAFMEANQANTDPAAGLDSLRELIKRAAAVPTDGLPEELAAAYQNMTAVMQRVQGTLDDLPVPVDQFQKYTDGEKAKGGVAAEEIMAKRSAFEAAMTVHQKDGEAASAKLREIGAKYGIEALELGAN